MSNMLRQLLMDPPTPELKVGPYTIKRVTDPHECELAFRHRHDVYVQEGYLEAGSVPDGIYNSVEAWVTGAGTITVGAVSPFDPADLDQDDDVDDADFGIAFAAFTGPNNGPSSNPAADLDR